ncbi:MAG: DUF2202 domain-containing protein [Epsilonproteobacteria bacterium]|nr:DUF2202 domain-containing protein [Campylobacterota bacterium]
MTNFDEALLLSQQVDPSLDMPIRDQILRIALYDEYHAYQTYRKVIETFGPELPFINIIEAEQRHINALIPLLQKYGVALPVDDWYEKIELPQTLVECCEVGVGAEIENIKMYDNLLKYAQEEDIVDVLYRLQAASYNNHLPSFRACVAASYQEASRQTGNSEAHPHEAFGAKHHDLYKFAESLVKGDFDSGGFAKLVTGDQKELILGGLLGAGLTMAFSSDILKDILQNEAEEK